MSKKNRIVSLLLVTFLSLTLQVFGDESVFYASVSKTRVTVGEQIQLSFVVNGNGSNFRPPDLSEFAVYSGPNQSTSMQIINGNVSQSLTIYYVIAAKQEGKFTVGSASIVANGKKHDTKPIQIEAVKGAAGANPQGGNRQQGGNAQDGDYPQDMSSNVFMLASVSKNKVYQGEQLIVTYKVYTRVNIVDNAMTKAPTFDGFWSEDINEDKKNINLYDEVLDGIVYKVGEVKKNVLIPQRSGELLIDPMEMDIVTRIRGKSRGSSIFDQFFGPAHQDVKVTIKSKPIKIQVMPLPENGKPASFKGAIGNFTMTAKPNRTEMQTNDAGNYIIQLNGKGNIKLLEIVQPEFNDDIEVYDPKISDKVSVTASGVSGSKTFDYLFIPRHPGDYKMAGFEFSYFDPATARYVTLKGDPFTLAISKSANYSEENRVQSSVRKKEVSNIGEDIMYIITAPPVFQAESGSWWGAMYLALAILLPLMLALLINFFLIRHRKKYSDAEWVARRNANKTSLKRLKRALELKQPQSFNEFYEELFKALYGYVSSKFNIPVSQLNKEFIIQTLEKNKVNQTLSNELMEVLNRCEFARYSPVKDARDMDDSYKKSVELITKLEEIKL
jgi:hypothetical protein